MEGGRREEGEEGVGGRRKEGGGREGGRKGEGFGNTHSRGRLLLVPTFPSSLPSPQSQRDC